MRLPADSQAIIYATTLGQVVTGVSGQRYLVKPNLILLDIKSRDANAWIAAGRARKPATPELTGLDGHLARLT